MNQKILRLLDANFNRAREALRVMEDYARFVLDDTPLSTGLKQARHDLSAIMAQLGTLALIGARDTPGDVGTVIATPAESRRENGQSVVIAAAKRLSEALRSLEESLKIVDPALAARVERLRYQGYQLEKQLITLLSRQGRFDSVRLYVLVTSALCRPPLIDTVKACLDGGADAIQLREKALPDGQLLKRAAQIGVLCHQAGALFIMNDRPDLAILAGADGLHLGQEDLTIPIARNLVSPNTLIGASTHNLDEAQRAIGQKADYLAIGSIFGSPTKPQVQTVGLTLITEVRTLTKFPIVAIGGISLDNAHLAIAAGASAVAVCQAIITSDDPCMATARFKERLAKN